MTHPNEQLSTLVALFPRSNSEVLSAALTQHQYDLERCIDGLLDDWERSKRFHDAERDAELEGLIASLTDDSERRAEFLVATKKERGELHEEDLAQLSLVRAARDEFLVAVGDSRGKHGGA